MEDLKEFFLLYEKVSFDPDNYRRVVPKKLKDYFEKLGKKKFRRNHVYKNLDEFYKTCVDFFLTRQKKSYEGYMREEPVYLKVEEKEIQFKLTRNNPDVFPPSININLVDKNPKEEKISRDCVSITWTPFLNMMDLNSLFYGHPKEEQKKYCQLQDITKKPGKFMLDMLDDFAKRFGVKIIALWDASTFYDKEKKLTIPLAYSSLQKYGKTYYGRNGYRPTKYNFDQIQWCRIFDLKIKPAEEELEYVLKKIKKVKNFSEDEEEWFKTISDISDMLPRVYYKKI